MLKESVRACMGPLAVEGEAALRAEFRFPSAFEGFRGHFPGKPVLPGICLVQAVLVMLEAWQGRPARLAEIVLGKFYAPVGPEARLECVCRDLVREGSACTAKALFTTGQGKKVAQLTLRVSFSEGGDEAVA
jgi:3-hydroxymyristoyl/3-hydroxydecanoyl-(acyl carrier protein) dehydratase